MGLFGKTDILEMTPDEGLAFARKKVNRTCWLRFKWTKDPNEFVEPTEVCDSLIIRGHHVVEAWQLKAEIAHYCKGKEQEFQCYLKAMEACTDPDENRIAIDLYYDKNKDYEKATQLLEVAYRIEQDPLWAALLASSLRCTGRDAEGQAILEAHVAAHPEDREHLKELM